MKHIWTVACSHAVVDRDSNNVSLLNIIEQLTIHEAPRPDAILPIQLDVMTLWAREDAEIPTTDNSRLRLISPDGKALGAFESAVDLSSHERSRAKITFQGLPLASSGTYKFIVEQKSEEATRWKRVAEIPLSVTFSEAAS